MNISALVLIILVNNSAVYVQTNNFLLLIINIKPNDLNHNEIEDWILTKSLLFRIPSSLRKPAASMIVLQLQSNPARRPSVDKLLQHEFFSSGIMPAALPLSCLTTAPRTDQLEGIALHRRPLNEVNTNGVYLML